MQFPAQVGERYVSVVLETATVSKFRADADQIVVTLEQVKEVVQKLIEVYAKTFRVNFSLRPSDENLAGIIVTGMKNHQLISALDRILGDNTLTYAPKNSACRNRQAG